MQVYVVYKITNLVNNKYYIGVHKTESINDQYMGSGVAITNAVRKYGQEKFNKEILDIFFREENAYKRERELVGEKECCSRQCYNIKPGGTGGFSKESSEKGRVAREQLRKTDPEWAKKQQSHSKLGMIARKKKYPDGFTFKQSAEAIINQKKIQQKIGHQQGPKNSQYGRRWMCYHDTVVRCSESEMIYYFADGYQNGKKYKAHPI